MARFRFGVGDYKYFAEPLPEIVQALRSNFYPPLASVPNRWMEALGGKEEYPPTLAGAMDAHFFPHRKPTTHS